MGMLKVEITDEKHQGLKHQPSGTGFEDNGTAFWPADSFTYKMRDEGAIRVIRDMTKKTDDPDPAVLPGPPAPSAEDPGEARTAHSRKPPTR